MNPSSPSRLGASGAALLCALLVLGCQLPVPATAKEQRLSRSRATAHRALRQVDPLLPSDPPFFTATVTPVPAGQPNATDLAVEALNVTGTATNQTVATIFAPTDAAFESLAMALNLGSPLDLFNATYNASAANITALHVIPGEAITTSNLTTMPNITLPSLLGYNLTITTEPNGTVTVTVPGSGVVATVVTPNIPFNGSIVHVIDKVLLPPANETATWALPLPPTAGGP